VRSAIEYLPVDRKIERWFRPDEGESGSSRLRSLGDRKTLTLYLESVPCGISEMPEVAGVLTLSLFHQLPVAVRLKGGRKLRAAI